MGKGLRSPATKSGRGPKPLESTSPAIEPDTPEEEGGGGNRAADGEGDPPAVLRALRDASRGAARGRAGGVDRSLRGVLIGAGGF